MTVFCNKIPAEGVLLQEDWVVSSTLRAVVIGIEAGCNTVYVGEEMSDVTPTLFAPTEDDALRFIKAYEQVH
jgi:hypothetical protein